MTCDIELMHTFDAPTLLDGRCTLFLYVLAVHCFTATGCTADANKISHLPDLHVTDLNGQVISYSNFDQLQISMLPKGPNTAEKTSSERPYSVYL